MITETQRTVTENTARLLTEASAYTARAWYGEDAGVARVYVSGGMMADGTYIGVEADGSRWDEAPSHSVERALRQAVRAHAPKAAVR